MDVPVVTKDLLTVIESTKYSLDAFLFVQRGLDYTVRDIHGQRDEDDEAAIRHVSGRQLCSGLREYAVKQYGLLALSVLNRWRINSCEDFGNIVFSLVDAGLMHKTSEDSIEDFIGVFEFDVAFSSNLYLSDNLQVSENC